MRCLLNELMDDVVVESRRRVGTELFVWRECGRRLRELVEVTLDAKEAVAEIVSIATGEMEPPVHRPDYRHYSRRIRPDAFERTEPVIPKRLCPEELPSEIRARKDEEARRRDPTCYCEPDTTPSRVRMVLGKDRIEAKAPTPMQEIDDALRACTFGRFHIRVLGTALVGIVANVLVSNSTAYLLPNAECDLNMNLLQKGMLNAMPYFGMTISSLIAGFLTDTFGRKLFLVSGYGGIFLCTLVAGTSQTYEVLLTAKFIEGVFFATSFSPTVTYTSEFCHKNIRDRVMLCQSSFIGFSQVLIAAMSWGILTNDWTYTLFGGYIVLNSWNFYLYLMSLWSLAACLLYAMLPESPKYLITQQRYDEARDILVKTYVMNTSKPADTFPYPNLWKSAKQQVIDESPEHKDTSLSHQLVLGLYNVKPMFKMPLVVPLVLISSIGFLVMALYNVYRLWFPQLSTIVEHYSFSGTSHGDLCVMLDAYTADLRNRTTVASGDQTYVCVPNPSGAETYINSIIVGAVCLIPYPISGLLVNKVGKKFLLFGAGVLCVCTTIGLRWADSKAAVVTMFSIDIAVSQAMMSLSQALTVEVFPTTIRTLAISIVMTVGRIGTLAGNITFPIFLNMGCVVPFFGFAGLMILVTAMTLFLPSKKK